jgi:hypothetical protein
VIDMPTAFVLINTEIGSEADVLKELKKVEGVDEAGRLQQGQADGQVARRLGDLLLAHGALVGANPVVASTPTKVTRRTFSLDVTTLLGDLLTISFREMGERVATS